MGLKWRGALRCGRCGKPRGLGTHLCSPGRRRPRRTALMNPVTWECGTCHKNRGLRHTSHIKTDFKKRRRAAARKAGTAERRRKRQAVRARQAARRRQAAAERRARAHTQLAGQPPRPLRTRGDSHEPGTCGDRDCPRYGCKSYFQGMEDCPLEHAG